MGIAELSPYFLPVLLLLPEPVPQGPDLRPQALEGAAAVAAAAVRGNALGILFLGVVQGEADDGAGGRGGRALLVRGRLHRF